MSGFTDPRGSEKSNAALSKRRADSVAGVLASAGIPADRIVIEAHGEHESTSADGDLEGYAFERRVTVRWTRSSMVAISRFASVGFGSSVCRRAKASRRCVSEAARAAAPCALVM